MIGKHLGKLRTSQVVILNGACGVKNPGILRSAQNDGMDLLQSLLSGRLWTIRLQPQAGAVWMRKGWILNPSRAVARKVEIDRRAGRRKAR